MSHHSFSLTLLRGDQPRMHLNSGRSGLLLNVTRLPCRTCDVSTSAECFEASLPHLPRSSRAPSTSEPSSSLISSTSLARGTNHHVLDLASHCCSAGTLGFDHACIRPRPSWTSWGDSRGTHLTPCRTSSGTSAPASLCCLVTLRCSGTLHYLQQHFILVCLLLAMLFLSWVLGSQSLSVSLSSRPFGTCFIHHIQ